MAGSEVREFRVVWQGPDRTFWRVGWLHAAREGDQSRYRFGYQPIAELPGDFRAFLAFPHLEGVWESDELFPFFRNRVLSPTASGYSAYLAELGLSPEEASPIELLARTLGRRETDTVQVVPAPRIVDGLAHQLFLASGVRHVARDIRPDVSEAIARLRPGAELTMVDDRDNAYDPRAVLLDDDAGPVGWVPQYLLDELHKARGIGPARCLVVHANGPDAPWHVRLLCELIRPRLEADEPGRPDTLPT